MKILVQSQDVAEVLAYDNMINAFITRLVSAVQSNNMEFITHYQQEIKIATTSKQNILTRMRNEDFAGLTLVQ